jgi:hypothetical protein
MSQVPAREPPVQIGVIPNWSPVLDFATTDRFLTWNQTSGFKGAAMKPWNERDPYGHVDRDRVFITSGRGVNGSITELMSGVKAKVTLDVEYGSPLRRAWVFRLPVKGVSTGFTLLLDLHSQTSVVQLTPDLEELKEHNAPESGFDTTARTLTASQLLDGTICQITEAAIILLGDTHRYAILTYVAGSQCC